MDAQTIRGLETAGLILAMLGILGFALVVAPALAEASLYRLRIWWRVRQASRQDHAVLTSRHRARVQEWRDVRSLSVVPETDRRVDHDDAA